MKVWCKKYVLAINLFYCLHGGIGWHTYLKPANINIESSSFLKDNMKEINIKYGEYLIDVLLSTDNTSIIDSYRIKRINDMINILKKIRNTCDNSYAIHKRSIFGMVNEWRVHNLLYFLHIKRKRTCTVDLNINQSIWVKIAYTLLSIFYF